MYQHLAVFIWHQCTVIFNHDQIVVGTNSHSLPQVFGLHGLPKVLTAYKWLVNCLMLGDDAWALIHKKYKDAVQQRRMRCYDENRGLGTRRPSTLYLNILKSTTSNTQPTHPVYKCSHMTAKDAKKILLIVAYHLWEH